MCMFYRLYGWLSSLALFFIWSTSKLLQSHFKQTLIYFEVTLIMPVMSFFKENITPPENNSSAEISILFWHFSRIYRYFSRNVSFYSEQYSLLFRTMQIHLWYYSAKYCSFSANYQINFDILRKTLIFRGKHLASRSKLLYFARNIDISLELIPQLLVIWQVATQFQSPKNAKNSQVRLTKSYLTIFSTSHVTAQNP